MQFQPIVHPAAGYRDRFLADEILPECRQGFREPFRHIFIILFITGILFD
jgi:hypothetical protein